MRNVPILEHCALAFCAFLESCPFEAPASFRHDLRVRPIKEGDLNVVCVVLSRVREFMEHH